MQIFKLAPLKIAQYCKHKNSFDRRGKNHIGPRSESAANYCERILKFLCNMSPIIKVVALFYLHVHYRSIKLGSADSLWPPQPDILVYLRAK